MLTQTIRTALQHAIAQLNAAHTDAPKTTARVLLAQTLGKPKEWLTAHDDAVVDATAFAQYQALLARVAAHEPMAYVLGHREFYGLDFYVDKRVLIPRLETEMLVELALKEMGRWGGGEIFFSSPHLPIPSSPHLLDIGTGSGAVPIAVAKHLPHAHIVAADVSADALQVARTNAERHGVAGQIQFVQSDLLSAFAIAQLPLVLTANLPYVTSDEIDGLQPEIQDHEPRVALDGGADGLRLIERLLLEIHEKQLKDSRLRAAFFEFGASQGAAVLALAQHVFPNAHCEIKQDLAKLDRVLSLYF